VDFAITPQVQKIQPDSELTLEFMYFPDHDKVAWSVADVQLKVDANDKDWINVQRHFAPAPDLEEGYQAPWHKVVSRQHPWDGIVFTNNDVTRIMRVVDSPGNDPAVLYSAFYAADGSRSQDFMQGKLDLLMKNLRVRE
jgi:hypothetical protein